MINHIIDFSIRNKLIIGLLTLVLIGAGIWSVTQVPIDAVPDITNNQVQVITQAPNLGTEEIEQFVTYPVEVGMANLPGVQEIRSVSRFGLSVVTIVFEDDMGTYLPRQLVSEKLTQVKEEIPAGFGEPFMGPISTGLGEIYQYTLSVDEEHAGLYSATDLRTMQDWIVSRQMAMVPGVVEVNAFGGDLKQYEVAVDPGQLRAMNITLAEVFTALSENNQNTGGAYIEKDHQANFIRGEGLARSLSDIENIVVKTENGIPVRIADIGTVQFGKAVRYGAFTKDGEGEAVGGMILMLKGGNSNKVVDAVKDRMVEIQKSLPEGVQIEPFLDRSKLISSTTSTVTTNLVEGALIVIFVLVFLLGNWRGGLIVASTIPLSLLFAFILMNVFDVWANLMSLGAIDFGIIVDGAVIIVEGTVFFLVKNIRKTGNNTQEDRDKVTFTASSKMMNSAFFGQLIILIVFVPILFLEGVEGKMFIPMALTFMFAMIGAMILCLTYVPMISSLFIRVTPKEKKTWGDRIVIAVENWYERALNKALKRVALILVSAVLLFGLAIFTFSRMGGEFIPQLDEGDIAFHAILKPGSSLTETVETTTKIEQIVKAEFPEVLHVLSRIGVAEVPTDPMPMDIADIIVVLKPQGEWETGRSKQDLVADMKEAVSIVPGVNFEFTQPIEMRFNELLTGVREDIAVKLYGEDLDILAAKAEEMGKIIATVQGVGDMKVEATSGLPQITVDYDRARLAQYGLNVHELNTLIETGFAGGKAGVIFEGEKRFDLVLKLKEANRRNIEDIRSLYVNTPMGAQIPLREVANISYQPGPMQISRDNTNRRTYVGINVRGRDVKTLVEEIREKLDKELELPPGYYIRYGGAFENLERATERLKLVVPIALALIFVLIFFALKSIKQSVMIYLAIPMAAIGGVFSLWLRDMPFSISAGVGFIVLFGVAVLNGLVLISGWNELKEEGVSNLSERITQGARRRIRPILLTALTDVLGFLPMALSTTAGAEVQRPLATVVIGGLLTSTLLTLFVLPILYKWMEEREGKSVLPKTALAGVMIIFFCLAGNSVIAQNVEQLPTISMKEAIEKSAKNFPKLKAARLQVEQEQALKKTAWNLGNTQVYTAGEEISQNGNGVYTTIGVQQQNIDVFGIAPKMKAQKQRVALAESALELNELQLMQEVKMAYAKAYVAHQNLQLFSQLDSVYRNFEKGAKLRYDLEETSKLDYLAAANQVKQIELQKQQAEFDYSAALFRLNLWLVSDTFYAVSPQKRGWLNPILSGDSVTNHPLLQMASRQVEVANAERKSANAAFLPQLNTQYGWQEISGQSGFYQYQFGLTIPLFFMQEQGRAQAARIEQKIAEQEYQQTQFEVEANYQALMQEYNKWQASWQFYENEALPLAREQRKGAILAFDEGAIDYVTFIQNMKEAVQVEVQAREALQQYLQSKFQLEFYLGSTNN